MEELLLACTPVLQRDICFAVLSIINEARMTLHCIVASRHWKRSVALVFDLYTISLAYIATIAKIDVVGKNLVSILMPHTSVLLPITLPATVLLTQSRQHNID